MVLTASGETLRLWAVHHIGAISRTRSDRLGPLITSGPFGLVRNPLYIGNILIWVGFAVTAHLLWLAPIVLVLITLEYHQIVKWEEDLLLERRGEEYRDYCAKVPRWVPTNSQRPTARRVANAAAFSWSETFFSERGTLVAIAAGYVLVFLKLRS